MNHSAIKKQKGLSLIELMIAVVIGIFITGGIIQLFVNTKQSYRVQENLSRLQENGRFAMSFLSKDIRMADFWGCISSTDDIENNLNPPDFDAFATAVTGINNDANGANDVIDGTDTITVKGAFGAGVNVVEVPASVSADVKVTDNSNLNQNDIVIVSDCLKGDLFQITNDPSVGGAAGKDELVHNIGAVSAGPGNSDQDLQKKYDTDANVYKLSFITYSIQDGASGQPALFRSVNSGDPQELIEGIEDMQILYGEDTDSDGTPNYYVTANNVVDMELVTAVRISLLATTLDNNVATQAVPYTIFGATTTPGDRKIRRVFTSTMTVRNRLP